MGMLEKLIGCLSGMAFGLALDVSRTPLALLESLCRNPKPSVFGDIWVQLQLMPFLHVGMLVGWAVCGVSWRRLRPLGPDFRQIARLFAEFVVMGLWMVLAAAVPTGDPPQQDAFLGMLIGMVLATVGAAASLAAVDASFRLRGERDATRERLGR